MYTIKNILPTVLTAMLMVTGMSCSDFLDKDPLTDTNLNREEIFSDERYAPGFLNSIYNYLPDGHSRFGGAMLAAASDEAICSNSGSPIHLFNKNAINATTNPDDVWSNMYRGIRASNLFLQELGPDGIITQTNSIPELKEGVKVRDYFKGQAYFLRAYFHFELLKRYNNIFYISKVIDPFDENQLYAGVQLPFHQTVDSIVADLDSAASLMPATYPDDSYIGRPVRWTPLALKSRLLLYAASPLNNPSNDLDKWKRAADAAKVIIDSKRYSLVTLSRIFSEPYNPEIIFSSKAVNRNDIETYNLPVSFQGRGYMNPTEDLVSEFGMAAKTYRNRMADFDAKDPYSLINTRKREDRLRYTVFFNGSRLKDTIVATFVGGKDGLYSTPTATQTGYYMSKFVDQSLDIVKGNTSLRQWVHIRYAEILLNYAEALNEYNNTANFNAITAELDRLRNRANLRTFDTSDKNLLRDQNEMRNYIKRERRLELAFEEHRFWDLRRWKDAETVLNKPVNGIRITRDNSGAYTYTVFESEKRSFDPKMYWYPIPRTEILKYRNAGKTIIQNPGWE